MKNPNRSMFVDRLPERARGNIGEALAKRDDARRDPVVAHASKELAELKRIAVHRWGARALIQAIKDGLGYRLEIGYYADDRGDLPPWKRKETIVATGRSASEVLEMLTRVERAM